ncbi:MAG: alpha/beta hydrolase [Spirochaetaceae bacterium]|jgi:alpha-beta hydrolase superfamily lysophospholipase|nr:alpha/beta hydrolase [Spirochaetaceae bacterium]
MLEQELWLETDGARIFVRKWLPDSGARAVVNIVHGMSEHSGRYFRFAEALCGRGIAVWCADQRGHGKTASPDINKSSEGGLPGHCADKKTFIKILSDIDMVHKTIIKNHKNIPLIMFGHSWGSFLTQGYIEFYGGKLQGAALSGTRGPGGLEVRLGAPFLEFAARLCGVRSHSMFFHSIVFGSAYQRPFMPCRTSFDWLSRDEAEVDSFIADPMCGHLPSLGFYRDLLYILKTIHKDRNIKKISNSLPVYVFSGDRDPVGGMGKNVSALVKRWIKNGIKDVSFVLYPGARHECLNEINREEVTLNFINWLERHI